MRKFSWNIIIDTIAFVCFLFLISSGILMRFILPPGSGMSKSIWSLGRHDWGSFHFWIAVAFLSVMALHLFVHWNWIKGVFKGKNYNKSGKRFIIGLISLLLIILLAISPLLSRVEHNSNLRGNENIENSRDHENH